MDKHLGWNKWRDSFNWKYFWDPSYVYRELRTFFREIKWAWQRVRRGYDQTIYWNGDESIATFIYHVISMQRVRHIGVPSVIACKYDDVDDADIEWIGILTQGEKYFHLLLHLDDTYLDLDDEMIDEVIRNDFTKKLDRWCPELAPTVRYSKDNCRKMYPRYEELIRTQAFKWLIKWYNCLWD